MVPDPLQSNAWVSRGPAPAAPPPRLVAIAAPTSHPHPIVRPSLQYRAAKRER